VPPDEIGRRKSLGNRIKQLRIDRGMSQEQLAQRMQLRGHVRFVQPRQAEVESGVKPVTIDEAISYARILRVPLTELLDVPDYAED
jgi:transcriptional regulator with XRE-family HTH domain